MKEENITSEIDFAKALKKRRKDLGITQKQLADYCNLSHNGISRIEVADKSLRLSTLLKFSKILGFKLILKMEGQ